jgi:hypothetical protein
MNESFEQLNNKVYSPVGHCIYCGDTKGLQKEHILPFGLSGTAVLPKASCCQCAKITGRLEQLLLRGPMWPVRVYRELHSRTKHQDSPSSYPLTFIKEGKETTLDVPIEDYPILLHFPLFSAPAALSSERYERGIKVQGLATVSFGPHPASVAKKHGATDIKITQSLQPVAFAQIIAKIAFAYAVAEGASNWIDGNPWPITAILGKTDDIGKWVGTITAPSKKTEGLLHMLAIHRDLERQLVIGEIRLFSDSETPTYGVILGKLKKNI